MRLVHAQRQLRERGRIRIGYSTPSTKREGIKVPHKLDRFRFTAPDEQTIREVAALYGGTPEPWPDGGRDRFQVVTEADSLNVILPAGMALNEAHEQYRNGFPVLRCDGETCWTPGNGRLDEQPCLCEPDNRDCNTTTMLSLIVPDLAGLGTFRLVTHSYYANQELGAAVEMIESAMAVGMRVPCRLFLTHREVRRLVEGKPIVKKFLVPVLDLNMSVAALGSGGDGGGGALGLPTSAPPALPPAWRPVDQQALPEAPPPDVRSLLAENERTPKPRANAAPPLPATGVEPRTEVEHAAATQSCSLCGLAYGTAKLLKNPEPGGSRFVHAQCLPMEGEPPVDQPPPEDEKVRGGGGAASAGQVSAGVQPVPATDPSQDAPAAEPHVRMMTAKQQRMAMALSADVWPAGDLSGRDTDDMRRERLLWLCAVLGQPGLTSRTQITAATAPLLLDALQELQEGTLVLEDRGLVDPASGEIRVAAP